jgi:hypothetical protein
LGRDGEVATHFLLLDREERVLYAGHLSGLEGLLRPQSGAPSVAPEAETRVLSHEQMEGWVERAQDSEIVRGARLLAWLEKTSP